MNLLNATLRGIPLYLLEESGLFPQITNLANGWTTQHRQDPLEQARPKTWLIILDWSLIFMAIYFFSIGSKILGSALFGIGCFGLVLWVTTRPWKFTRAVNRLDECLKQRGRLDIGQLPAKSDELYKFLCNEVKNRAALVLFYKKQCGHKSELAEEWRQKIKELYVAAAEFGYDLGKHDEHYQQAQRELEDGTHSLSNLYKKLEEAPAGA